MTYEYDTQEIEAPAFLNDPKVMAYLEGTDTDINRLVLENDGKLWAHSKRTPGALCRSNLEAIVAVGFPSYFPATVQAEATAASPAIAVPVVAADVTPSPMTDPAPHKAPKATRKPRRHLCISLSPGRPWGYWRPVCVAQGAYLPCLSVACHAQRQSPCS